MIKHIYIYTDDAVLDKKFINNHMTANGIISQHAFTDVSFEEAKKRDVDGGLGKWSGVRIMNRLGKEMLFKSPTISI